MNLNPPPELRAVLGLISLKKKTREIIETFPKTFIFNEFLL